MGEKVILPAVLEDLINREVSCPEERGTVIDYEEKYDMYVVEIDDIYKKSSRLDGNSSDDGLREVGPDGMIRVSELT